MLNCKRSGRRGDRCGFKSEPLCHLPPKAVSQEPPKMLTTGCLQPAHSDSGGGATSRSMRFQKARPLDLCGSAGLGCSCGRGWADCLGIMSCDSRSYCSCSCRANAASSTAWIVFCKYRCLQQQSQFLFIFRWLA